MIIALYVIYGPVPEDQLIALYGCISRQSALAWNDHFVNSLSPTLGMVRGKDNTCDAKTHPDLRKGLRCPQCGSIMIIDKHLSRCSTCGFKGMSVGRFRWELLPPFIGLAVSIIPLLFAFITGSTQNFMFLFLPFIIPISLLRRAIKRRALRKDDENYG
jgi:uncharacterized protein (DUF983 family)